MEVEAAALQRLGELTRVVRREEDQRDLLRLDRAEFRDRDLVVREDLQQERLGLDLDSVDLVDEQDDWLFRTNGLEQRTGQQELVAEDVVAEIGPVLIAATLGLDAQQLLLVVPLVQRLGLVEAFVALQPDQPSAGDLRDALGQLGLSGTGRTLDKDRLLKAVGEVHDTRNAFVGQIVDAGELVFECGDVGEAMRHRGAG